MRALLLFVVMMMLQVQTVQADWPISGTLRLKRCGKTQCSDATGRTELNAVLDRCSLVTHRSSTAEAVQVTLDVPLLRSNVETDAWWQGWVLIILDEVAPMRATITIAITHGQENTEAGLKFFGPALGYAGRGTAHVWGIKIGDDLSNDARLAFKTKCWSSP